ncbi:MAG TPA: polysaccharide biosynthesis/export family protein [bacterium]|nr:polysaccharide biosynthesis/export family protein [bacterium]
MKTVTAWVLACLLVLGGCAGSKPKPQVAGGTETQITVPERPAYKLSVGDELTIRVLFNPEYSAVLKVRPDGVISVPYVGEINVDGMTPADLQTLIRSRDAEVLVAPEVTVIVDNAVNKQVMVFGEVRAAGAYDIRGPMTILDAIAMAGGVQYTGRKDSIVLIRQGRDGKFAGTRVNLDDILDGHGDNVLLMPRDVIYVPQTFISKVDNFVDQFFTKITPAWYFYIAGKDVVNPEATYIIGR